MAELEALSNLTCSQETSQPTGGLAALKKMRQKEACFAKTKPERMKTSSELKSWTVKNPGQPRYRKPGGVNASGLTPLHPGRVLRLAASKEGRASRGHPAQEDQECP